MTEQVIAQVTLYTRDGLSIVDAEEPITDENVARYRVEESVIDEAKRKFTAYGFSVGPTGPHGFTISGDKSLFETVFRANLTSRSAEEEAASAAFFDATEPLSIPDDLSGLVAGVALPTPPELFP